MNTNDPASPRGWVRAKLGAIGMLRTRSVDPSRYPEQEFELWSVPAFPGDKPEICCGREVGSAKQRVAPGDVLLCKINPRINRVWLVGPNRGRDQIASSEWIVFRSDEIEPRFLLYRLREHGFRRRLCADVAGVGGSLTRARPQTVKDLEIEIPPRLEQRRIVSRIESLQARTTSAHCALREIVPLLEQFRQSVLAAAFSGRLTADWRAAHPDVEPATEFLDRIRTERRRRWEESELAKCEAKGKKPQKNWRERYVEPEPVDPDKLPTLPDNWCWAPFELLTESFDFARVPLKLSDREKRSGPYPYYGASGVIDDIDDYLFDGNFLLIGEDGANLLARSTPIAFQARGKFWVNNHAHVVQTLAGMPLDYLEAFVNSISLREYVTGTAQPKLTQKALNRIPVALAPSPEHEPILEKVGASLDTANRLRRYLHAVLGELVQIDQSILAKAFRGELVPQDPSDEAASVLLERILDQREASGAGTKNGKAPPRATKKAVTR